jgi:endo-1,4-beta-xylanase
MDRRNLKRIGFPWSNLGTLLLLLITPGLILCPQVAARQSPEPQELLEEIPWQIVCPPDQGSFQKVPFPREDSLDYGVFFRFNVLKPSTASTVQMTQTINNGVIGPVKAKLSFRAISFKHNPIHLVYQLSHAPYTKIWERVQILQAGENPRHFFDLTIPASTPNQYSLSIQLGECQGQVSVSDISLKINGLPVSQDPAVLALEESIKPQSVKDRISAIRQGGMTVMVRSKSGQPVVGAKVEIKQLRHQFPFGCSLDALRPEDHSEFQQNYQKRFLNLFNAATLSCNWDEIEPQRGKYDYRRLIANANWCAEHLIRTSASALIQEWSNPRWLPKEPDAAVPFARSMVIDCIRHMGGTIQTWEVVGDVMDAVDSNEHNYLALWLLQEEKKMAVFGGMVAKNKAVSAVVESALLWAHAATGGKKETFLVSGSANVEAQERMYAFLEKTSSLPDGIGIKSEMYINRERWGFDSLYDACNRLAQFAPVHWTAIKVVSGNNKNKIDWDKTYTDWPSTARGEAEQCDYVTRMYRILFSHPNVASISWSQFCDKDAYLGAPSGLLRRNGSPKPAYNALMQLIHKEWWTHASGTTNEKGQFFTRAFFGDYQVTVTDCQGHVVRQQVEFRAPQDFTLTF